MGVVGLGIIGYMITQMPPTLSNVEMAQRVSQIEEVSYQTYDLIKKKYNIVGNDGVEIVYSDEGNTIEIKEDYFFQEYTVDKTKEVSDKESDEEFERYIEMRKYVNNHKDFRIKAPFLVVIVFLVLVAGWLGRFRKGVK